MEHTVLKKNTGLIDSYILKKIELAIKLLNSSYSEWKFLVDETSPESLHENPIDIDFQTGKVTFEVAGPESLVDNGCGLSSQPIYPYMNSRWHLHTHPNGCSKTVNKTICEQLLDKPASAAVNSMSGTDVNLLFHSTLSYSLTAKSYVPSVDGIVCEDGVIFYWLTKEFVDKFIDAIKTYNIPEDTIIDMVDDMSSDFVRAACTHLTSTPELANMTTQEQVVSLLTAVKSASFLPEEHTDTSIELDGRPNYGFWVPQQYHFVFVPTIDLQESTA